MMVGNVVGHVLAACMGLLAAQAGDSTTNAPVNQPIALEEETRTLLSWDVTERGRSLARETVLVAYLAPDSRRLSWPAYFRAVGRPDLAAQMEARSADALRRTVAGSAVSALGALASLGLSLAALGTGVGAVVALLLGGPALLLGLGGLWLLVSSVVVGGLGLAVGSAVAWRGYLDLRHARPLTNEQLLRLNDAHNLRVLGPAAPRSTDR
jgi:hypothetical protein